MEYFHISNDDLSTGLQLSSRFFNDAQHRDMMATLRSAWTESTTVLKAVVLSEVYWARANDRQTKANVTLKEVVLERVRNGTFPDIPSRLGAVFLCPTKEDALKFGGIISDRPKLYRCEAAGVVSKPLDLSFIQSVNPLMPIEDQLADLTDNAKSYWSGEASDDPIWEILTHDQVTVTEYLGEHRSA